MLSTEISKSLEAMFGKINEKFYENQLEIPVILVIPVKKKPIYGYCTTKKVWSKGEDEPSEFEIAISAEYLNRGLKPVMATLMHEAVHLFHSMSDIKDCCGYYHNNKFKKEALARGLTCSKTKYGWSQTDLTPETEAWIESLELNGEPFDYGRMKPLATQVAERTKTYTYKCPLCGEEIKSKNEDLQVICKECTHNDEEVTGEDILFERV